VRSAGSWCRRISARRPSRTPTGYSASSISASGGTPKRRCRHDLHPERGHPRSDASVGKTAAPSRSQSPGMSRPNGIYDDAVVIFRPQTPEIYQLRDGRRPANGAAGGRLDHLDAARQGPGRRNTDSSGASQGACEGRATCGCPPPGVGQAPTVAEQAAAAVAQCIKPPTAAPKETRAENYTTGRFQPLCRVR